MTKRFEERLLTELKHVVAENEQAAPTAAVRPARWRLGPVLGVAALGIAGAVVVPMLLPGGGSAAYALEKQQDGTVRVEIKQLSDAAGLERKLGELGIKAKVDYLPEGKTCKEPRFAPLKDGPKPGAGALSTGLSSSEAQGTAAVFTFNPADFTGDRTAVIETSGGGDAAGLQVSFAEGQVAACVPVDAPRQNSPGQQNESGDSGGGSDENR